MVREQEEGTVVGLQLQHPLLYKVQEVQEAGEVQEVQEVQEVGVVGEDLLGGGSPEQLPMSQGLALRGRSHPILHDADDAMDVDSNVVVPPGDPRVVRGQSQVIKTRADSRSEALALEAFSLVQGDGAMTKCSGCSNVGQLKKCARPGCPFALCFQKSNMHTCISNVGLGEFWCPPCWGRSQSTPLPYSVVAEGTYLTGQNFTRCLLAFHTIALKHDAYAECLLQTQLEEEFVPWKNMLCRTSIELFTGAACLPHVCACVRDALAFVKAKPEADFLVLMDTHSDYDNGELVHSVDKHGNAWTQDASEVLCHHLGPELWKRSLDMAGTKGMILLACGSTFTKPLHFEKSSHWSPGMIPPIPGVFFNDICGSSKRLQFITGFTAHSVQPSVVMPFILWVIIQVYIHHLPVEQALEQEIAHWSLLSHTPVVLICWNKDKHLISPTISGNVWGLPP
ncbi:hypothetical protein DFJ58DRAFT_837776 [Suillus subalutaceus]|uniref:uncharacterized protein n=1 Tax=Suillus subalutaceus TaxID=48586 RepID=UPI001B871D72|nr:uncharacterized protein DFJ58DRAFT_837776 [Suillus subalutaceus]KAG1868939.1 hypothetical protein DFJ58DRAFT_837776 [Suillus subalutaceus]